jgi:hypothetical protein
MSPSTPNTGPRPLPAAWDWRSRYRYYQDLPGWRPPRVVLTVFAVALLVAALSIPIVGSRVTMPRTPAPGVLVPIGADSVTVQRYGALSDTPPYGAKLERTIAITDQGQTAKLAAAADALPAFPAATMSCPMDDGSYYRLTFAYSDGPPVTLFAQRTGCQGVGLGATPGVSLSWSATDRRLLDALDALFG